MMFIYMPGVFNDDFIPYINQIITPILKVSWTYFFISLKIKIIKTFFRRFLSKYIMTL